MKRSYWAGLVSLGLVSSGCVTKRIMLHEDESEVLDPDGGSEDAELPRAADSGSLRDAGADARLEDASPALDGAVPDAWQQDSALDGESPLDDAGGLDDAGYAGDASTQDGESGATLDPNVPCAVDNGGITLPAGFCATRYAEGIPGARHLVVTPAGDLFVATAPKSGGTTSVVALRDVDGDGRAETRESLGTTPGNGIDWSQGFLYFASNTEVVRWALPSGVLKPSGAAELIVTGLPDAGDHKAKSVVVNAEGDLFVNIGSASNSCQQVNRTLNSPGIDPCLERDTRGGVWKFSAHTPNQTQVSGSRFVAGTRNANALALNKQTGALFAAQNGRDQLFESWPALFTPEDDVRLPAEGLFQLVQNDDYGWPYCFYDAEARTYLLAPEYGGDGELVGRCTGLPPPVTSLPAHWAPLGMAFYDKQQFPAHYRNGLFVATHGSRFAPDASAPLPGYNVVFIPFERDRAVGAFERFAEGFAGPNRPLPEAAQHRPVGVAVAADGALFVSDDQGGVIWRIAYRGQ
jgi:glucose/arabinose dehydrogenase